jgi:hypothetical protein
MRHLDDGQIAELIDSAGRWADGQAGRDIGAHLSECSACRERVEEARQIAARARSILATAVPVVPAGTSVPPFDEILHRAGQGRRAGKGGGSLRWLAWAATVVVAGGLGWYARGELRQATRSAAPAAVNELAAESDSVRPVDEERANLADAAPPANGQAGTGAAVAPGLVGRVAENPTPRQEAGAREGVAARDRGAAASEAKAAAPPPATSAPAPLPVARNAVDSLREAAERLALRRAPVTEAEQAPAVAVAGAPRADFLDRRIMTREEAERVVGGRLAALDDLPVETYYQMAGEPGVIRTEQTLPRGGKLELEQRRATTPRSEVQLRARLFAQQPMADSVFIVAESLQVDGLWIVARAPISADSLRVLLRRLRR